MRWIVALSWLLLLAACSPTPASDQTANATPSDVVFWERDAQTVIFRADVIGGESDFRARNAVPNCTIYGDNRMVWVNELGPFKIEVREDRLPDGAISAFVQYLTVNERIYTYDARLPQVEQQSDVNPVVETVLINVNGVEHHGDSLGGWDRDWFPRVLNACKSLSLTPVLVAPSSGWLSAREIPFSMQPPLVMWDPAQMGVSLASAPPDAPQWISGENAASLWQTLHSLPANMIFEEGDQYYEVALQVPGITRDSPPAS